MDICTVVELWDPSGWEFCSHVPPCCGAEGWKAPRTMSSEAKPWFGPAALKAKTADIKELCFVVVWILESLRFNNWAAESCCVELDYAHSCAMYGWAGNQGPVACSPLELATFWTPEMQTGIKTQPYHQGASILSFRIENIKEVEIYPLTCMHSLHQSKFLTSSSNIYD